MSTFYRLVLIALVITGCTTLGYQLGWIRLGALQFGSTTSALSCVTTTFFAGMALGTYISGRLSYAANYLMG